MKIYMMIDLKDNELPLAVADTVKELAQLTNKKENNISSALANVRAARAKRSRYVCVEVDDDED